MAIEYNLDVEEDCPLCCEPLNHDLNFYPCQCAFQICSICWNRIKELEGNLCPNCRVPYPDEPYSFKPLTEKQEALIVQRDQRSNNNTVPAAAKPKVAPIQDKEKLRDVRVMQKNLVFVVGLQPKLADESMLRKQEYFASFLGRFGKIMKVAVNQCTTYAGVQGPSASAYVTFSTTDAALRCIQTVHGLTQDGRTLKATLGTTKYCSRFLNGQQCKLQDCMYLHEIADPDASFTKEDMQKQKHTEYERRLMDNFRRACQAEQARKEAAERERRLREQLKKKEEEASRKKAAAAKVTTPHAPEAKRPRKPPVPTAATVTANTVTLPKQNQNPRSRPAPPKPKSPKVQKQKKNIYVDSDDESELERITSKQIKDAVDEDVKDSWDTSDEEDCHKSNSNSGKSSKSNSKPSSRAPSRNGTPLETHTLSNHSNHHSHSNSQSETVTTSRPNSQNSRSSKSGSHRDSPHSSNSNTNSIQKETKAKQNELNLPTVDHQLSQAQIKAASRAAAKQNAENEARNNSTISKNLFANGDNPPRTLPSPVEDQNHLPVSISSQSRLPARSPVNQPPAGLMFDPFALNPLASTSTTSSSRLGAPPGVTTQPKASRSPPGFSSSFQPVPKSSSSSSQLPFNPFDSFFSESDPAQKLQSSSHNQTKTSQGASVSQGGSLFNRLPTVDQLKDPFARKPPSQTNGVSRSSFATPPPGLGQAAKDWDSNSSARSGMPPPALSRRVPPAGLFDTGSSHSSSKLVPGLDGVDPLLFGGGSGRMDPPASSLMPRPIPDLLRNGGIGRSRQDSADFENLDFDPIDYSMKGLSKLQLNEPRSAQTHRPLAASPQLPSRSIFGDLQSPSGMMGLFGERPAPRPQSGKDEGLWQENLRRLLPNVNVHFTYNEQMSRQNSSFSEHKPPMQRGPPGLGGPPGFSQSPLLGFPDAGNAFARQNSRQPVESEFIPKGLLD
ncbi:Oidioi.mRNA.OKI2018_I69.chr2.g5338.t1.cds [Oikopleura dioica]|uniref:Oidioi.mRNA.OKI2018_I69.chr2.g5338.t1.cds n=1 Tax=Oikopleura dioica TaxID=34765 RepID=A0ABN7T6M0_OIKDI|nr:Oidioi.mRNA.OKI2018_I69.chr2.g5338.t1.cds [Oikopleura dioica]